MKKVRIITFHDVTNYGAILQAYALCKVIESFGFDVKIINYKLRQTKYKVTSAKIIKKCRDKFEDFKKIYLPMTEPYNSLEELNKIDADYLICGSDQVWNFNLGPEVRNNSKVLFLQFGNGNAKRISYAASTGGSVIPEEYQAEVKSALEKFDAISVREPDSVSCITKLTKKPIQVTLDPTLLWDDYPIEALEPEYKLPEKYIVIYLMQKNQVVYDVIKKVRKKTSLPIVNLRTGYMPVANKTLQTLSPGQWLCAIKNAEFVICNSFHATVFSIKFNKRFVCLPLLGKSSKYQYMCEDIIHALKLQKVITAYFNPKNMINLRSNFSKKNNRLENILDLLGIKKRFYDSEKDFDLLFEDIDYTALKLQLDKLKEGSLVFLNSSLK